MSASSRVHVISFGYGHTDADGALLGPPTADIVLDVRRCLYNPHHLPEMRYATGLDDEVYEYVMSTPGAHILAANAALTAHFFVQEAAPETVTVAVGCVGGRHRAVGMARATHQLLAAYGSVAGYRVELTHRDVHRAVLPSRTHEG